MVVHPALARARVGGDLAPLLEQPQVFEQGGIRLRRAEFPVFVFELKSRKGWLKLKVDARDYDYRPPDGVWVDGEDRPLVPGTGQLPTDDGFQPLPQDGVSATNWLCFAGWRAYHDHSSHQDVAWAALRTNPEFRLLARLQALTKELTLNANVKFI